VSLYSHASCAPLAAVTTQSLADLQKALVGSIGMSDQLDALGSCLLNGFLPDAWRKLAPATEKTLGAWMIHFQVYILYIIPQTYYDCVKSRSRKRSTASQSTLQLCAYMCRQFSYGADACC
jgi:Dynein heavy chain C-terminal domain